jgi:hypothetical protein
MKIAITTIATGKYDVFVPSLIDSCEKYFLPNLEKKYFIFTDSNKILTSEKVVKVNQGKLGWPYDTMMRFHMFSSLEKELEKFDFVFFMNANMEVVSLVSRDILPTEKESGLVATHHPGFYRKHPNEFTYERNRKSNFYIPFGSGETYVQGCFNGGRSKEFLKMCREIKERMDADLRNEIIPVWHDESALNWYLLDKNPKILHPVYAWPEFVNLEKKKIIEMSKTIKQEEIDKYLSQGKKDPYLYIKERKKIRIIQRDKNLFGGKTDLRS